jgi:hypothetical protein
MNWCPASVLSSIIFSRADFSLIKENGKPRAGVTADQIEALANIAIIGAGANIRISDRDPLAYFAKYGINEQKRAQQFVEGPVESMTVENYPAWLTARAEHLAKAARTFLTELKGGAGDSAAIEAAA